MNITRWFDFIQHQQSLNNNFPVVNINRIVPENWTEKKAEKPEKADKPEQAANQTQAPTQAQTPAQTSQAAKGTEKATQPQNPQPGKEEKPQEGKKKQQQQQQPKQPAEGKKAQGGGKGGAAPKEEEKPLDISRLDIRVGKIVKVDRHPAAESLYVEEIDLGETTGPRQVVSGLVNFVPIEQMRDRYVVVLCNLKPANLRGVKSAAMVLAASNEDHTKVELLDPPHGSQIGERVFCEGYPGQPDDQLNPKQKVWETVQPELRTTVECVATYKNAPFQTAAGLVRVTSIAQGTIK
jgi:methionyl-tRNA synthetase